MKEDILKRIQSDGIEIAKGVIQRTGSGLDGNKLAEYLAEQEEKIKNLEKDIKCVSAEKGCHLHH